MVVAAVVAAVAVIGVVQPRVASNFENAVISSDVYALPSPEQTLLISLGHRAALADVLYAAVRVSYGRHTSQRRRFEFVENYLDTITTLDPHFVAPYLFADTFLTLQQGATVEDYRAARRLLLRGTAALPYHQLLWSTAGQFMAYLAPSRLDSDEERQEWRLEGARLLAHACSLASDNENIPYHCISAAGILGRAGEREAQIRMLQRTIDVTDDPEIRRLAQLTLDKHVNDDRVARKKRRNEALYHAWRSDLPFVSPEMMLLVGPRTDVFGCAGKSAHGRAECASSWRDWGERQEH